MGAQSTWHRSPRGRAGHRRKGSHESSTDRQPDHPGSGGRVAQIFAESDATELPGLTGVTHRSLYCLHDLCVHLLETSDDVDPDALAAARNHPLFRQVNERLSAHTSPYLPTWRSPRDAIAGCFYRWDAAEAPVSARPAPRRPLRARPLPRRPPRTRPADMSAAPPHVLIIGAGTGGLCLAHGLRRAGISVAVYERDRTRTDGLHGYRVGIDPDGSRALHACLPPELYATFVATCARAPRYFNMLTEQLGEVCVARSCRAAATDPVDSEKSVSRMTLRQVLLTGLEDVVHFDKTFTPLRAARRRHGDRALRGRHHAPPAICWSPPTAPIRACAASTSPRPGCEDSGILAHRRASCR